MEILIRFLNLYSNPFRISAHSGLGHLIRSESISRYEIQLDEQTSETLDNFFKHHGTKGLFCFSRYHCIVGKTTLTKLYLIWC